MLKFCLPSCTALVCALVVLAPLAAEAAQTVPFVGCPSDGQQGPVAAPKGQPKAVNVEPTASGAARLVSGALHRGRARAARLEMLLPLRFERDDAGDRAERRAERPEPADRRPRRRPH